MASKTEHQNPAITPEFIQLLRTEGNKALSACLALNADKKFQRTVGSVTDADFLGVAYKAEHLLLYDLVKLYHRFALLHHRKAAVPSKVKFTLLYLYEKLRGKDLAEEFDVGRLRKLPFSDRFERNLSLIQETSFFQPIEALKTEYVTPLVLTKMKSQSLQPIASFLNRMALLMARSDGKVSPEEEEVLKQVSEKINRPKTTEGPSEHSEVPEGDTLEKVMEELNGLIGLNEIKKNVQDLTNFLKVQKIREEKGLKTNRNSLHAVFMGPPGTGKTTVARLLGRIFRHLGYLKRGHLVETDRSGLVAGYVGQTAIKADDVIAQAADGVLFIDEAYALASGGFNDFGKEAIEVLLKRMEDMRGNLVVVVAGYPDEMEVFIQSNPGLQSRFNRYFTFDHYRPETLIEIFKLYANKADFKLTEDAEDKLSEIIDRVYEKKHRGFGNARTMRNLFEKIIERQANRIVNLEPITEDMLITLTETDVPNILDTVKEILVFEGGDEAQDN